MCIMCVWCRARSMTRNISSTQLKRTTYNSNDRASQAVHSISKNNIRKRNTSPHFHGTSECFFVSLFCFLPSITLSLSLLLYDTIFNFNDVNRPTKKKTAACTFHMALFICLRLFSFVRCYFSLHSHIFYIFTLVALNRQNKSLLFWNRPEKNGSVLFIPFWLF